MDPQRLTGPLHYHKSYQLNEMERRTSDLGVFRAGAGGGGWGWGGVGWGMDPIKHLDFIGLFYYLNVPAHEQGCRGESRQKRGRSLVARVTSRRTSPLAKRGPFTFHC